MVRRGTPPRADSAWTFERATLEWSTSPTIATCCPSIRPNSPGSCRGRAVPASGAGVCRHRRLRCRPGSGRRDGRADLRVAQHNDVRVVGADRDRGVLSDSPLSTAEPVALIDIASAESRSRRARSSTRSGSTIVEDVDDAGRGASAAFHSRSSDRSSVRGSQAGARHPSGEVGDEIRCRLGGRPGGRRSSRRSARHSLDLRG